MYLTFPLVLFWWHSADDQSKEQSKSRHFYSKHCHDNCVMCSHYLLRNGTVQTCYRSDGLPVTMVVLPLRQRCSHQRVIKFIIPNINGPPRVIHQLLMQAGDVETNPGPGKRLVTTTFFLLDPQGLITQYHSLSMHACTAEVSISASCSCIPVSRVNLFFFASSITYQAENKL